MTMAFFLRLDGVAGESTDASHLGEMDLLRWSWGLSNGGGGQMGAGGGVGAGIGKVSFSPLQVIKLVDQGSPTLMGLIASGRHVAWGQLTVVAAGDPGHDVLTVALEDVLVTSWSTSESSGDERAEEEVTLAAGRTTVTYRTQNPDGSIGDPVVFGWDAKLNQKV